VVATPFCNHVDPAEGVVVLPTPKSALNALQRLYDVPASNPVHLYINGWPSAPDLPVGAEQMGTVIRQQFGAAVKSEFATAENLAQLQRLRRPLKAGGVVNNGSPSATGCRVRRQATSSTGLSPNWIDKPNATIGAIIDGTPATLGMSVRIAECAMRNLHRRERQVVEDDRVGPNHRIQALEAVMREDGKALHWLATLRSYGTMAHLPSLETGKGVHAEWEQCAYDLTLTWEREEGGEYRVALKISHPSPRSERWSVQGLPWLPAVALLEDECELLKRVARVFGVDLGEGACEELSGCMRRLLTDFNEGDSEAQVVEPVVIGTAKERVGVADIGQRLSEIDLWSFNRQSAEGHNEDGEVRFRMHTCPLLAATCWPLTYAGHKSQEQICMAIEDYGDETIAHSRAASDDHEMSVHAWFSDEAVAALQPVVTATLRLTTITRSLGRSLMQQDFAPIDTLEYTDAVQRVVSDVIEASAVGHRYLEASGETSEEVPGTSTFHPAAWALITPLASIHDRLVRARHLLESTPSNSAMHSGEFCALMCQVENDVARYNTIYMGVPLWRGGRDDLSDLYEAAINGKVQEVTNQSRVIQSLASRDSGAVQGSDQGDTVVHAAMVRCRSGRGFAARAANQVEQRNTFLTLASADAGVEQLLNLATGATSSGLRTTQGLVRVVNVASGHVKGAMDRLEARGRIQSGDGYHGCARDLKACIAEVQAAHDAVSVTFHQTNFGSAVNLSSSYYDSRPTEVVLDGIKRAYEILSSALLGMRGAENHAKRPFEDSIWGRPADRSSTIRPGDELHHRSLFLIGLLKVVRSKLVLASAYIDPQRGGAVKVMPHVQRELSEVRGAALGPDAREILGALLPDTLDEAASMPKPEIFDASFGRPDASRRINLVLDAAHIFLAALHDEHDNLLTKPGLERHSFDLSRAVDFLNTEEVREDLRECSWDDDLNCIMDVLRKTLANVGVDENILTSQKIADVMINAGISLADVSSWLQNYGHDRNTDTYPGHWLMTRLSDRFNALATRKNLALFACGCLETASLGAAICFGSELLTRVVPPSLNEQLQVGLLADESPSEDVRTPLQRHAASQRPTIANAGSSAPLFMPDGGGAARPLTASTVQSASLLARINPWGACHAVNNSSTPWVSGGPDYGLGTIVSRGLCALSEMRASPGPGRGLAQWCNEGLSGNDPLTFQEIGGFGTVIRNGKRIVGEAVFGDTGGATEFVVARARCLRADWMASDEEVVQEFRLRACAFFESNPAGQQSCDEDNSKARWGLLSVGGGDPANPRGMADAVSFEAGVDGRFCKAFNAVNLGVNWTLLQNGSALVANMITRKERASARPLTDTGSPRNRESFLRPDPSEDVEPFKPISCLPLFPPGWVRGAAPHHLQSGPLGLLLPGKRSVVLRKAVSGKGGGDGDGNGGAATVGLTAREMRMGMGPSGFLKPKVIRLPATTTSPWGVDAAAVAMGITRSVQRILEKSQWAQERLVVRICDRTSLAYGSVFVPGFGALQFPKQQSLFCPAGCIDLLRGVRATPKVVGDTAAALLGLPTLVHAVEPAPVGHPHGSTLSASIGAGLAFKSGGKNPEKGRLNDSDAGRAISKELARQLLMSASKTIAFLALLAMSPTRKIIGTNRGSLMFSVAIEGFRNVIVMGTAATGFVDVGNIRNMNDDVGRAFAMLETGGSATRAQGQSILRHVAHDYHRQVSMTVAAYLWAFRGWVNLIIGENTLPFQKTPQFRALSNQFWFGELWDLVAGADTFFDNGERMSNRYILGQLCTSGLSALAHFSGLQTLDQIPTSDVRDEFNSFAIRTAHVSQGINCVATIFSIGIMQKRLLPQVFTWAIKSMPSMITAYNMRSVGLLTSVLGTMAAFFFKGESIAQNLVSLAAHQGTTRILAGESNDFYVQFLPIAMVHAFHNVLAFRVSQFNAAAGHPQIKQCVFSAMQGALAGWVFEHADGHGPTGKTCEPTTCNQYRSLFYFMPWAINKASHVGSRTLTEQYSPMDLLPPPTLVLVTIAANAAIDQLLRRASAQRVRALARAALGTVTPFALGVLAVSNVAVDDYKRGPLYNTVDKEWNYRVAASTTSVVICCQAMRFYAVLGNVRELCEQWNGVPLQDLMVKRVQQWEKLLVGDAVRAVGDVLGGNKRLAQRFKNILSFEVNIEKSFLVWLALCFLCYQNDDGSGGGDDSNNSDVVNSYMSAMNKIGKLSLLANDHLHVTPMVETVAAYVLAAAELLRGAGSSADNLISESAAAVGQKAARLPEPPKLGRRASALDGIVITLLTERKGGSQDGLSANLRNPWSLLFALGQISHADQSVQARLAAAAESMMSAISRSPLLQEATVPGTEVTALWDSVRLMHAMQPPTRTLVTAPESVLASANVGASSRLTHTEDLVGQWAQRAQWDPPLGANLLGASVGAYPVSAAGKRSGGHGDSYVRIGGDLAGLEAMRATPLHVGDLLRSENVELQHVGSELPWSVIGILKSFGSANNKAEIEEHLGLLGFALVSMEPDVAGSDVENDKYIVNMLGFNLAFSKKYAYHNRRSDSLMPVYTYNKPAQNPKQRLSVEGFPTSAVQIVDLNQAFVAECTQRLSLSIQILSEHPEDLLVNRLKEALQALEGMVSGGRAVGTTHVQGLGDDEQVTEFPQLVLAATKRLVEAQIPDADGSGDGEDLSTSEQLYRLHKIVAEGAMEQSQHEAQSYMYKLTLPRQVARIDVATVLVAAESGVPIPSPLLPLTQSVEYAAVAAIREAEALEIGSDVHAEWNLLQALWPENSAQPHGHGVIVRRVLNGQVAVHSDAEGAELERFNFLRGSRKSSSTGWLLTPQNTFVLAEGDRAGGGVPPNRAALVYLACRLVSLASRTSSAENAPVVRSVVVLRYDAAPRDKWSPLDQEGQSAYSSYLTSQTESPVVDLEDVAAKIVNLIKTVAVSSDRLAIQVTLGKMRIHPTQRETLFQQLPGGFSELCPCRGVVVPVRETLKMLHENAPPFESASGSDQDSHTSSAVALAAADVLRAWEFDYEPPLLSAQVGVSGGAQSLEMARNISEHRAPAAFGTGFIDGGQSGERRVVLCASTPHVDEAWGTMALYSPESANRASEAMQVAAVVSALQRQQYGNVSTPQDDTAARGYGELPDETDRMLRVALEHGQTNLIVPDSETARAGVLTAGSILALINEGGDKLDHLYALVRALAQIFSLTQVVRATGTPNDLLAVCTMVLTVMSSKVGGVAESVRIIATLLVRYFNKLIAAQILEVLGVVNSYAQRTLEIAFKGAQNAGRLQVRVRQLSGSRVQFTTVAASALFAVYVYGSNGKAAKPVDVSWPQHLYSLVGTAAQSASTSSSPAPSWRPDELFDPTFWIETPGFRGVSEMLQLARLGRDQLDMPQGISLVIYCSMLAKFSSWAEIQMVEAGSKFWFDANPNQQLSETEQWGAFPDLAVQPSGALERLFADKQVTFKPTWFNADATNRLELPPMHAMLRGDVKHLAHVVHWLTTDRLNVEKAGGNRTDKRPGDWLGLLDATTNAIRRLQEVHKTHHVTSYDTSIGIDSSTNETQEVINAKYAKETAAYIVDNLVEGGSSEEAVDERMRNTYGLIQLLWVCLLDALNSDTQDNRELVSTVMLRWIPAHTPLYEFLLGAQPASTRNEGVVNFDANFQIAAAVTGLIVNVPKNHTSPIEHNASLTVGNLARTFVASMFLQMSQDVEDSRNGVTFMDEFMELYYRDIRNAYDPRSANNSKPNLSITSSEDFLTSDGEQEAASLRELRYRVLSSTPAVFDSRVFNPHLGLLGAAWAFPALFKRSGITMSNLGQAAAAALGLALQAVISLYHERITPAAVELLWADIPEVGWWGQGLTWSSWGAKRAEGAKRVLLGGVSASSEKGISAIAFFVLNIWWPDQVRRLMNKIAKTVVAVYANNEVKALISNSSSGMGMFPNARRLQGLTVGWLTDRTVPVQKERSHERILLTEYAVEIAALIAVGELRQCSDLAAVSEPVLWQKLKDSGALLGFSNPNFSGEYPLEGIKRRATMTIAIKDMSTSGISVDKKRTARTEPISKAYPRALSGYTALFGSEALLVNDRVVRPPVYLGHAVVKDNGTKVFVTDALRGGVAGAYDSVSKTPMSGWRSQLTPYHSRGGSGYTADDEMRAMIVQYLASGQTTSTLSEFALLCRAALAQRNDSFQMHNWEAEGNKEWAVDAVLEPLVRAIRNGATSNVDVVPLCGLGIRRRGLTEQGRLAVLWSSEVPTMPLEIDAQQFRLGAQRGMTDRYMRLSGAAPGLRGNHEQATTMLMNAWDSPNPNPNRNPNQEVDRMDRLRPVCVPFGEYQCLSFDDVVLDKSNMEKLRAQLLMALTLSIKIRNQLRARQNNQAQGMKKQIDAKLFDLVKAAHEAGYAPTVRTQRNALLPESVLGGSDVSDDDERGRFIGRSRRPRPTLANPGQSQ
jgi:hypothetical protein